MKTHEERQFRIPIDELRSVLKKQHGVDLSGVEPFIEGEHLVFALQRASSEPTEVEVPDMGGTPKPDFPPVRAARRQRRRKRNRVKTRGWRVIERITNSHGLRANIYEPFVVALRGEKGTRAEQRAVVRGIMERNGNSPTPESVDYFLDNTLEYLHRAAHPEVTQP
jgi:hypothetical protein